MRRSPRTSDRRPSAPASAAWLVMRSRQVSRCPSIPRGSTPSIAGRARGATPALGRRRAAISPTTSPPTAARSIRTARGVTRLRMETSGIPQWLRAGGLTSTATGPPSRRTAGRGSGTTSGDGPPITTADGDTAQAAGSGYRERRGEAPGCRGRERLDTSDGVRSDIAAAQVFRSASPAGRRGAGSSSRRPISDTGINTLSITTRCRPRRFLRERHLSSKPEPRSRRPSPGGRRARSRGRLQAAANSSARARSPQAASRQPFPALPRLSHRTSPSWAAPARDHVHLMWCRAIDR